MYILLRLAKETHSAAPERTQISITMEILQTKDVCVCVCMSALKWLIFCA